MFCEKIKPMIPGLLKAHCSVKASPAGIYDMTLGRYLTDDDVITPCTSHNPGLEAVPAHHPSLKGKTIAQIKSMLLKLEDPVSVPSKILIKPLRILATEKLNAADRRCVQLDSRHHLDLDSHSDLTELSTSESEDNNASKFKENNMFKSSQGKSEDDNTQPTSASKTRTRGGVKNPNKTFKGAIQHTISPPSKNTVQTTRPHAVKTPRQTPTNPRATAGTDHDTVSPTSTSTSPPKRPRSIKTPCQTPENHQTAAGTDHKTVSPASISIGPPLRARADKTTCQILAAALLPGVVFSDGHANTPPLENCPSQERNSPVEEAPLFDLPSQQCVSEPLIPSNPQDPKNQTLMLLSAIDFSKPLPDKSSSSPNIPMIFLDKPLEAYHPPIPLAVLPFTTVVSQQTKEEQPLLAEIVNKPQAPSIEVTSDEPLSPPPIISVSLTTSPPPAMTLHQWTLIPSRNPSGAHPRKSFNVSTRTSCRLKMALGTCWPLTDTSNLLLDARSPPTDPRYLPQVPSIYHQVPIT
ncbi:hypothetical protein Pst134EA_019242 [Puccinia striiformis f. sp. tritici]|uniref:hypothetical protein n=1 Tax=Puccinia striiformis f. sp. tritici TaxID=168172 RepID=UPI002007DBDD|nr:hypothetical protein Pst134EA_019242 [Puccinia striiformis f. sp. tritici]KAH9459091.1 hypothetical protein Pst134EA_019242 [Puccinia striiformis f. sp. tritici]